MSLCCLCHVYEIKPKRNPLWELIFPKSLKLNLCMFTIFINKPEVAEITTVTQQLSSRDPTEKSSISHSYIYMLSLEDAGVGAAW